MKCLFIKKQDVALKERPDRMGRDLLVAGTFPSARSLKRIECTQLCLWKVQLLFSFFLHFMVSRSSPLIHCLSESASVGGKNYSNLNIRNTNIYLLNLLGVLEFHRQQMLYSLCKNIWPNCPIFSVKEKFLFVFISNHICWSKITVQSLFVSFQKYK